jgi:hypothetical protein
MQITAQGVVFPSMKNTDGASACFPSICVLPNGRWIAGARLAPAKSSKMQRAFIRTSDDQGKTWSPLVQLAKDVEQFAGHPWTTRGVSATSLGGNDVVLTLCTERYDKPLEPMFNEATEGIADMKLMLSFSSDGGKTFGPVKPVICGEFKDQPTPITGPAILLPNGALAVQFEVNKHYHDTTPWQHRSAVVITKDCGATWSKAYTIHTDPARKTFCWDQRISVLPTGRLVDYFWTYDMNITAYKNIHECHSDDNGITWTPVKETNMPGQPARAVGLKDGRIVLPYVNREGAPSIRMRISSDGLNFPQDSELIVHDLSSRSQIVKKDNMNDAWSEMSKYSLGLPDATLLPDGDVLVVFYSGEHFDQTSVHWARVKV